MWRLPCRAQYNRFRPAGKDAHETLEGTVGTSPRSNQRQPPAPSIPSTTLRLVILFEVGRAFSGQGRSRSDLVWLMVFHDDLALIGGLMRANMSAVCGIHVRPDGTRMCGADPRRGAQAIAW